MASRSLIAVRDDSLTKSSSPGLRSVGPTPKRSITPRGERIGASGFGRLSPEQADIARLRCEIEDSKRRLVTMEVALGIVSKTHELLAELSKSSRDEPPHTKP